MGNERGVYKIKRWQGIRLVPQPAEKSYFLKPSAGEQLLIISPVQEPLELMLSCALNLSGPFSVFFILNKARSGKNLSGTYQSPQLNFRQVEEFCLSFKEFFERDSRHHLCLSSATDKCILLLDSHNLVCAGGRIPYFISLLNKSGFSHRHFPFPRLHIHCSDSKYDEQERQVLDYFQWKRGRSASSGKLLLESMKEIVIAGFRCLSKLLKKGNRPL